MRENKTLHYYMKWALMLTFMWVCQFANAQDFVKGKVIDQAGEPVTGAYVRWKDTKIGASTDVDGNFSIPAHQGKLVISFLGYKTKEVSAQSGKQIEVKLEEDAQHLDEFVVIGYGLQKKSSITGSIETIKADDLLMMPTANLDNALTGQVAGLQVMASTGDPSTAKEAALHIRGINSAPLLVIDGVPRFGTTTSDGETRLSDLNPDDIESITVLKDAAAAAVYGARAANGVILVQTKRAEATRSCASTIVVSTTSRKPPNCLSSSMPTSLPSFATRLLPIHLPAPWLLIQRSSWKRFALTPTPTSMATATS